MSASRLAEVLARIGPLDRSAMTVARARQDRLTKPTGSLGRLEGLAVQLAGINGRARPRFERKAVIVCAADHGVAARGVSAYPSAVTAQMVANFLRGGAAINVVARRVGARVVVVDMGVAADLPTRPCLVDRKIGRGTCDMTTGPAMTRGDAARAVEAGIDVVAWQTAAGLDIVATGDMGIGNTTAASAIVAVTTGQPVGDVVGRGTGIDEGGLARKVAAIERALALNNPDAGDSLDVLAKVGGYEIGGLVGVILGAAAARLPVVLDGLASGAAALLAVGMCPEARDYLVAGHRSVEPGHRLALDRLGLEPLLDLDMRLGEGTGAALAMHLLDDACALLDEMATFEEAGVSDRESAGTPANV